LLKKETAYPKGKSQPRRMPIAGSTMMSERIPVAAIHLTTEAARPEGNPYPKTPIAAEMKGAERIAPLILVPAI
jgi:hypothetical protein